MSFPSLSAGTYGHGKIIQISPRPGRFTPIGSAFPTAGKTVEDTRKNVEYVRQETKRWLASIAYLDDKAFRDRDIHDGYFCRMDTYDFVLDCLRENAKAEDLAVIHRTLKAFLEPLAKCAGFVVRDDLDHDDLLRHCYEALIGICYTIVALDASQGVDPSRLPLIEASISSAKMFIADHDGRVYTAKATWRIGHPVSWLSRKLVENPKGAFLDAFKSFVSPITKLLRVLRKKDAHLDIVPEHLRQPGTS